MEIISQLIQNLNSLSKTIFFIVSNLTTLNIKNDVDNSISSLISNPEINDLISSLNNSAIALNEIISPIALESEKEIKKKHYHIKQIPYAPFIIDEPPIVKDTSNDKPTQLSFDEIINDKPIKPVKRRKPLIYTDVCPHCGAPNEYIYSNVKDEKQYKCKCCLNTFTLHPHYHEEISYCCPHCSNKLALHHERSSYDVLYCTNDNCKFYLKNKDDYEKNKAEHLKTFSNHYKLRYYFRLFNISFDQIKESSNFFNFDSKIDLNNIHHSQFTLGLILTYYVNYGLSCRKTAQILEEVHNIKISHQTVINYAEAAANLAERINNNYEYDLSDTQTADETYIKILGKTNYAFLFSDTSKKIITSYRIYPNRDTTCAIKSTYEAISKYKKLPDNFKIITDGNPIYNATQVFFATHDIKYDLYQVIGVKNNDSTSKLYRPYKQTEERLNRTYKQNYYGTNGYGSHKGANVFMSLFVCFFNFLRKHSSLNNETPVEISEVKETLLMPNKWLKLLELAMNY